MNDKMNNCMVKLISSVISLVLCLGILIMTVFAWYATNKQASVSGGIGKTYGDDILVEVAHQTYSNSDTFTDYVEYSSDISLNNISTPGTKDTLRIRITNRGDGPITIQNFGFTAVDSSDEASKDLDVGGNTYSYYLGTQLAAVAKKATINGVTNVLSNEPQRLGTLNGTTYSAPRLILYTGPATLNKNESLVLEIQVEFVNSQESQNAYKDWGNTGEYCKRRFSFDY